MAATRSDALVLFGVTGDLAHKMIFPALYALAKRGALKVPVIGVAFPKWSLARLRRRVKDSIERSGGVDSKRALQHLLARLRYVSGDYNDPGTFTAIKEALRGARRPAHYLAIPPSLFATVIEGLGGGRWAMYYAATSLAIGGIRDDVEAGSGDWTHAVVTPGFSDQWHRSLYYNHTPGGRWAWRFGNAIEGPYASRAEALTDTVDTGKRLFGNLRRIKTPGWVVADIAIAAIMVALVPEIGQQGAAHLADFGAQGLAVAPAPLLGRTVEYNGAQHPGHWVSLGKFIGPLPRYGATKKL